MVGTKCWESSLKASTPEHVSEKSEGGYDGNTKVRELEYSIINVLFSPWGDPQGVYL
jgi:hypothetical protein